jgi:hypothetical protein
MKHGIAVVSLLILVTACSAEPTDDVSACRDFEQAFTATSAGHMSNAEWVRHFTADREASTGLLGRAFRLDHIDPALIAQECQRIGVAIDLSKK